MRQAMYWPDSANGVNDVLKKAVRVQTECGQNRTGAIATLADWLGVSPQIVKARINDEVVGEPRCKGLLAARCWDFLALIAERERAWVENLAAEVEQNRIKLLTDLNVEDRKNRDSRNRSVDPGSVARDESQLASAHRALDDFENVRARRRTK